MPRFGSVSHLDFFNALTRAVRASSGIHALALRSMPACWSSLRSEYQACGGHDQRWIYKHPSSQSKSKLSGQTPVLASPTGREVLDRHTRMFVTAFLEYRASTIESRWLESMNPTGEPQWRIMNSRRRIEQAVRCEGLVDGAGGAGEMEAVTINTFMYMQAVEAVWI